MPCTVGKYYIHTNVIIYYIGIPHRVKTLHVNNTISDVGTYLYILSIIYMPFCISNNDIKFISYHKVKKKLLTHKILHKFCSKQLFAL